MNHEQIKNQLSAYFDGEVSAENRAALERHIEECGECAAIISDMRRLSGWLGASSSRVDVTAVSDRTQRAIESQVRRRTERLVGWLSALAASIALAAGVHLLEMQQAPRVPVGWEGQAARLSEDPESNRKVIMAQWIVTGLSHDSKAGHD